MTAAVRTAEHALLHTLAAKTLANEADACREAAGTSRAWPHLSDCSKCCACAAADEARLCAAVYEVQCADMTRCNMGLSHLTPANVPPDLEAHIREFMIDVGLGCALLLSSACMFEHA